MIGVLRLIFLLLPAVATAAPPCWPGVTLPLNVQTRAARVIKVGEVVYAASSVGLVWGYSCVATDGKSYKAVAGGPWSAFPADWLYLLDTAMRGTDADRAALWAKYATATAWDARLKPDVDAVWALLPEAPVWTVAPNSTYTTRPTYAWANGVRAPVAAAERVAVGSSCDPAVGTGNYRGVLGRADRVAVCVQK